MNCKIIQDLLPLYYDDVVSVESRELVDEHLKTCAECRKMLTDIHENVTIKNDPNMEQPMANGFKVLKKRLHRKNVSKIAISIICAVAIVSALTYGVFFYELPVSCNEAAQNIPQPINSASDFITKVRGHNSIAILQKGDALYIGYSDTFWTRYIAKPNRQPQMVFCKIISTEIPKMPELPDVPDLPDVTDNACPDITDHSVPSIPDLPDVPDMPDMPDPFIQIGNAAKVFYLEGNLNAFSQDDADFSKAAADAVLLWEK